MATPGAKVRMMRNNFSDNMFKAEEHVSPVVKFTLFVVNVISWVFSSLLLFAGIYSLSISANWSNASGFSADPSILLIIVALLFFVIGLTGAIGSLRENIKLLNLFYRLMIGLVLVEICTAIACFFLQSAVRDAVMESTVNAMKHYQTTIEQTALDDGLEEMQILFQCCGANSPYDWKTGNAYYRCTKNQFHILSSCGVPASCCRNALKEDNRQCGFKVFAYPNMTLAEREMYPSIAKHGQIIWSQGCVEAIFDWVKKNWIILGGLGFGVLIVQLIGIEFARKMIVQIEYLTEKFQA